MVIGEKRNMNFIYQEEWSILKEFIQDKIDELDKELAGWTSNPDDKSNFHQDGTALTDDELRSRGESRNLRDFLVVLKEKMDYVKGPIQLTGL